MQHVQLFESFVSSKKYLYTGVLDGMYQIGIVTGDQARYLAENLLPDAGNALEPYRIGIDTIVFDENGVRTAPLDILEVSAPSDEDEDDVEVFDEFEIPEGGILALVNTGHGAEGEVMDIEDYVEYFNDNYDGGVTGGRYDF